MNNNVTGRITGRITVYIGFAIDMDRAYSDYNIHGNLIQPSHPEYEKYNAYKKNFISETNRLIEYFKANKNFHASTWFVNEPAYNITLFFRDILDTIIQNGGEIGLHTHLNDVRFNGSSNRISNTRSDWELKGIVEPSTRLYNFTGEIPYIFKSGNHMRHDQLFDELTQNNYSIDTTCVINDKNIEDGVVLFDDMSIKYGTEPFFINTANGVILEIPEIRASYENCLLHVERCSELGNVCFLRFQIHHWQYDELIPIFNDTINLLKQSYDVKFASIYEMQRIYFKKLFDSCNKSILLNINHYLSDDTYYNSLKVPIDNDFFDVSVYLFNHIKRNSKFLELFSGIGQRSYFLEQIGFSNLTILDFDEARANWLKKYTSTKIASVVTDFFEFDINPYDVVFCSNSINSCLCQNVDVQIEKYRSFLEQGLPSVEQSLPVIEQNKILILNKKYGSYDEITINTILDGLKQFDKKYIGPYIILQKVKTHIVNFSKFFTEYNTINFVNIQHSIITIDNKKIIRLNLETTLNSSAGIFFPIGHKYPGLKKSRCTISFSAKCSNEIDPDTRFKIYTGIKWITIDTSISTVSQHYELTDEFDFSTPSTYRIGFKGLKDTTIFITDFDIVSL